MLTEVIALPVLFVNDPIVLPGMVVPITLDDAARAAVDAARSSDSGELLIAPRLDDRYPATLDEYLARCHAAGQAKPTPLLLRYGPGDYNCLHQDLYGECVFPLQATVLLSDPRVDFTGGDFILATQRPRMQSRADVAPLSLGDAVIFAVRHRPVEGSRGYYRVNTRHGVGTVRSGERRTLGLIFHDAA